MTDWLTDSLTHSLTHSTEHSPTGEDKNSLTTQEIPRILWNLIFNLHIHKN